MSFSSDVKTELCRAPINKSCCAVAECYGILLFCNTFASSGMKLITESHPFAKRLPKLFKKAFGFSFDIQPEDAERAGKLAFLITDTKKLDILFDIYGYDRRSILAHHINLGILEEDCCRQSFLRGAFLAGGSVTDPKKRYHLEFVTDHFSVGREVFSLLLDMGFEPKSTSRAGNYITYFKQSETIEDFLTTIGAPVASMEIMSAKIMKDMRSSVNRRVNCDTANVEKTVEAAQEQLEAIRKLEASVGLKNLPDKLAQTAFIRVSNPEASLSELALLTDPPVTKSCLNHRLRKLMELAADAKE